MPRAETKEMPILALITCVIGTKTVALRAIGLVTVNGQKSLGSTAQLVELPCWRGCGR
jgi:hypothetical protein